MNINKILSDYNELIDLTKSKISILKKLDSAEYSTFRGIDNIDFSGETVCVTCDDSSYGSTDYSSFEFPISWLTKSDEELTELVTLAREIRIEKERIRRAEIDQKVRLETEQKELNEYNRLKAKFENTNV